MVNDLYLVRCNVVRVDPAGGNALVDRMGGESDRSYDSRDLRCNPGCLLYSVPQVCHFFYTRRAAYGRTAWPTP